MLTELMLKKLGEISGLPIQLSKNHLIIERRWNETLEFRSGDLPTESQIKEIINRVVYDLVGEREIHGRLSTVGLTGSNIKLAKANLL